MNVAVAVVWGAFWLYWLIAAIRTNKSAGRARRWPVGLVAVIVFALTRVFVSGNLAVHNPVLRAVGLAVLVAGLGIAVWARIHLGRNWGMPMTAKDQPELVTAGPYRLVRHPIYSGLLLAMLGSALTTSAYWLIALGVLGSYFIYSARVEERLLSASFPERYPSYRARTRMLIPFLL